MLPIDPQLMSFHDGFGAGKERLRSMVWGRLSRHRARIKLYGARPFRVL